jgi:hypothetical protein
MSLTSYQTAPPCNVKEGETLGAEHSLSTAIFREPVGTLRAFAHSVPSNSRLPVMAHLSVLDRSVTGQNQTISINLIHN